jgi:glycosyltransferase involved in cell wall biosynthesis
MTAVPAPRPRHAPPSRLRVVVPALWFYPERKSGSSRLAYDEACYLASLGHEVWLVAQHAAPGGAAADYVRHGDLHVLRYARPAWAGLDPRPKNVHIARTRRLLARHVPAAVDLVHCHTLLTGAAALDAFPAARTCYSLHSPVAAELAATGRGAWWPRRLRLRIAAAANARLEQRCLSRCDVVTADSRFTRELVERLHGRDLASRVQVVPGWVDFSRFTISGARPAARQALGWPGDRPVLFSVRRLVPRMGIDRLLDAALALKRAERKFLLVLAGSGPDRTALEAKSRAAGLTRVVTFAGTVPDETLPAMYAAADAFVLPTAELECFGLIAVEALACGTPVLATPVGAIPEIVGEVEPAWLARDASAGAIADLVGRFLDGLLPAHAPPALRAFAEARFAAAAAIPRLAALALGEPVTPSAAGALS